MAPARPRLAWRAVLLGAAAPAGLVGAAEGAWLLSQGGPLALDLAALRFILLGPLLAGPLLGAALWLLVRLLQGVFRSDLPPWRLRAAGAAGLARAWTGANLLLWLAVLGGTDLALHGLQAPPGAPKGAACLAGALLLAWIAGALALPRLARAAGPARLRIAGTLSGLLLLGGLAGPPVLAGPVFGLAERPARVAAAHNQVPGLEPLPSREDPGPPGPGRPDVILVTLDTTRADHLTAYGYDRDTTPRLAEFAREAVRFDQAWAASSWTVPTHASLFTGLYPYSHGARYRSAAEQREEQGSDVTSERFRTWIRPLDPVHTTLAEILRSRGYRTGAFVAGPYLLADFGLAQGYDWYDDRMVSSMAPRLGFYYWLDRLVDRLLPGWMLEPDLLRFGHGYRRADELTGQVLPWLARQRGQRLHLFVNYFDAHYPYWPVRSLRHRYPGSEGDFDEPAINEAYFQVMRGERKPAPEEQAWIASQYDAELRFQDEWMGRLFDALQAEGRWEEALVIVTADHGEHLGEAHGEGPSILQHGFSVYAPVTHVPLLVKFPRSMGVPAGSRAYGVHQCDVLPTVLQVLGLDPSDYDLHLQGRPLLDDSHPHVLLSELYRDEWRVERFGQHWSREVLSWGQDGLRLHRVQPVDANGEALGAPSLQLFRLASDPLEGAPLAPEEDPEPLQESLDAWLAAAPRYRPSRWILDWDASGARDLLDETGYGGGH